MHVFPPAGHQRVHTHCQYYAKAAVAIIMIFHSEPLTLSPVVFQTPAASLPSTVKTSFVLCFSEEDFPVGKEKKGENKSEAHTVKNQLM